MSPLVTSEILGQHVNTLTFDDKYSPRNSESLPQTIQMQLSKKLKIFLDFLLNFWNLHQIVNILKKRDDPHGLCIPKIINYERRG